MGAGGPTAAVLGAQRPSAWVSLRRCQRAAGCYSAASATWCSVAIDGGV